MSDVVFGRVPWPSQVRNRLIPDAQNAAWNSLGPRAIRGLVYHRAIGTLNGTDQWFRRGYASTGLTDFMIGVESIDGTALAGVAYMWNDPTGTGYPEQGVSPNRAPWASGPYSPKCSFDDGQAFVREYGVNAVNRDQVSIEISGYYETALDDASRQTLVELSAYWADYAKVPWNEYPQWGKHGYSFVRMHCEFCGNPLAPDYCVGGEKPCCGNVMRNEIPQLIRATAAFMQEYQTGGVAPTPIPDPEPEEEEDILASINKSGYKLDPKTIWPNAGSGAVSTLWKEYGAATGIWNPPGQPWGDDGGQGCKLYQFEGGPLIALNSKGEAGIVVTTA